MKKTREYSIEERTTFVNYRKLGWSFKKISEEFNVPVTSIQSIIYKYQDMNTVRNLKRKGRPKKTTVRENKKIKRIFEEESDLSLRDSISIVQEKIDKKLCIQTISKILNENGIFSLSKKKKPLLTKKHKNQRKKFCEKYLFEGVDFWRTILFSDESPFILNSKNTNSKNWRPKGEELKKKNVLPTLKHGPKINIWSSMGHNGIGSIHLIEGNMDSIQYGRILRKYLKKDGDSICGEDFIFMHDNDPKHKSKIIRNWLDDNNQLTLDWPSNSPDLNPIENLYGYVKRKLNKIRIFTADELWEKVMEIWRNIPLETTKRLIESMPKRIKEVYKNNGGYSKY